MNPSQAAIHNAVEDLSPAEFQLLAEQYAQRMFPARFSQLVPKGINPRGVTIRGWPDAYSPRADGRIDAMEATKAGDWRRHLRKDLDKAEELGPGRLAGVFLVIWAPTPDREAEREFRCRLEALAVPAERTTFVFQRQLVRDLCQPRFASVWSGILKLRCAAYPFREIRNAPLFGDERHLGQFAPSLREFDEDLVHRPALLEVIEKRLQQHGWAWVRGRGASGKTVLAARLAMDRCALGLPAYYLDLARTETEEYRFDEDTVFEVITSRGDRQVLFIIDNVHLERQLASALLDHWMFLSNESHLIMLGRLIQQEPDPRGTARPLESFIPHALVLESSEDDVAGVFRRLLRRHKAMCLQPPRSVLSAWARVFSGDLIAFSSAVMNQVDQLSRGQWDLSAGHASNYVRTTYLSGPAEERCDLLRLAAMAKLELAAVEEVLEIAALRSPLRKGLVLRSEHGRARHARYGLVHPGVGTLLLEAAPGCDEIEVLTDLCLKSGFTAGVVIDRLEKTGRPCEAAKILRALAEHPRTFFDYLAPLHLGFAKSNCLSVIRLRVLGNSDLDEILAAPENSDRVSKRALQTPLEHLASFLSYAEEQLPGAHRAIADALQESRNAEALIERALRTPLEHLAFFLSYAKEKLPDAKRALERSLSRPEAARQLAAVLVDSPLSGIVSFLCTPTVADDVVSAIDIESWERAWQDKPVQQYDPTLLGRLWGEMKRRDRPELAEAPASRIVSLALSKGISEIKALTLPAFSHVLRLVKRTDQDSRMRFTRMVATSTWLEAQYGNANSGSLAGALFSIWWHAGPEFLSYFLAPSLCSRLESDLLNLNRYEGVEQTGAIRLLGVSDLVGSKWQCPYPNWPDGARLIAAMETAAPRNEAAEIGPLQAQFWLGLRAIARLRGYRYRVPSDLGNRILRLWSHSAPEEPHQKRFNEFMVSWLDRCASSGWRLTGGRPPAFEALRSEESD